MNDKQGDSLIAAIEGNFAGMAHGDLVLTCEMLTRGRAAWQKECEEAHAVLDDPECLIIRNEKDGYPEGRPDRTLTLAERVRALLRMKMDYKRWMTSVERERDKLRAELEALTKEVEELKAANDYNDTDLPLDELMGGISDTVMDFKPDCESDSAGTILERVQAAAELGKAASKLRTQKQELRELLTKTRQYVQDRLRENQKALANADPDSQFYGEDICSMPLLANIDKALAQTEVKP